MVETNDAELLDTVRNYFKILKKEPVSQEEIEAQEIRMIDLGLAQIDSGKTTSHADVRAKIKARLQKK